ncbi:MAG: HIT family protein [Rikenellaceae bacterium]
MASIFTKIIKGEIPCYKVAEDENYFAFLDISPLQKGHTLIIPKKEEDYIFDLDDETIAGMMIFAKKVAKSIKTNLDCKRVAVVVLGMEVPHAHIHLIPINSEKDVDFAGSRVEMSKEEFISLAQKLSQEIE